MYHKANENTPHILLLMPIYSFDGITPVVEQGAFVHPDAVLIGDVFVLKGAFVAPLASMRGDFGRLVLGAGANLQEHCCMHGFPGTDTIVEENGHIGHGAILHGCHIKSNAMVGMNSTVLDHAIIGENSIIGAGSLVVTDSQIEANSLAIGSPAKVVRTLTEKEIKWKRQGTSEYQKLSEMYLQTMQRTEPESTVNLDRPRLQHSDYSPKSQENSPKHQ